MALYSQAYSNLVREVVKESTTDKLNNWASQTNRDVIDEPVALFAQVDGSGKFGSIYLFSKFGQYQSCSLTSQSDITDHYTESNYHINDHWALRPEKYTLTGLIGEVIFTPTQGIASGYVQKGKDLLSPLEFLAPTLESYTQSAVNLTKQLEENIVRYENVAKNALKSVNIAQEVETSNQQYIIQQLRTLRDNRQLVKVFTPYGPMSNMAIESVNVGQQNTKYQSSLEVTLKQWFEVGVQTRTATDEEKAELVKVQQGLLKQQGLAGTSNITLGNSNLLNIYNAITK